MPQSSQPLPPYSVRVSPRARRVRLVVAPDSGLTVVTPRGFDPGLVQGIVLDRLDWVNHHLQRVRTLVREIPPPPERVELLAVERVLAVRYRAGSGRARTGGGPGDGPGKVRARSCGPASLEVAGDIHRRDLVDEALRAWLKKEAARLLPPLLAEEAARMGLGFTSVTVRLQRTRWGSCSARGGISLNARLLFLPPGLTRYVLAHELAHTRHLNHSPKYWRFLEEASPGARELDRALRGARQYVPAWARG